MNLIEVAKRAKDIVRCDNNVYCPQCNSKQFAPFDKLFVSAFDQCIICHPDNDEFLRRGENIFAIVNSEL